MCEYKICHLRYEEHNKTHRCSLGGFFSFRLPALPALITPRAGGFWHEQVGNSYLFGEILPAHGMNIGVRLRETPRLILRARQNAQDDAPARLQGSVLSRRLRREPP